MREDVDLLLTLADDVARRDRRRRAARHGRLVARARGAAASVRRRALPRARHDAPGGDPRAARRGSTSSARSSSRASKSGSTLETRSHTDYFWKLAPRGEQWVAITDPGLGARGARAGAGVPRRSSRASRRSAAATRRSRRSGSCRRRCSASTCARLLDRACEMAEACRLDDGNPGLELGLALGEGWEDGRDKVCVAERRTASASGSSSSLAESTGQGGQGPRAGARRVAATAPDRQAQEVRLPDPVRARPGVLPLGVRDRGRRLDPRHQPVRPARRAGGEGQDERGARGGRRRARRRGLGRRAARAAPSRGDYVCIQAFVDPTARRRRGELARARRARPRGDGLRRHPRLRPALPALDGPAAQGRRRTPASSSRWSTTTATS